MIPGRPSSGSYGAGLEPSSPTVGSATAGNTTASVSFTSSSYLGKTGSVTYIVTSSPSGITATGASSPITVSGLSNGTSYTFTVAASTTYGATSLPSAASNAVTPVAPPSFGPSFPPPCFGPACTSCIAVGSETIFCYCDPFERQVYAATRTHYSGCLPEGCCGCSCPEYVDSACFPTGIGC